MSRDTTTTGKGKNTKPKESRGWGFDKTGKPYIKGQCSLIEFSEYCRALMQWKKETNNGRNPKNAKEGSYHGSGFGGLMEDNFRK